MAQILYVKQAQGQKAVHIIRTWLDASGKSVYLHADGHYGYKDGSPLKARSELDLIGDKTQRALAQAWWDRFGQKQSESYYAALEATNLEAAGDFREVPVDTSELDAILYIRRPVGRKKGAVSSPHSWMEWFSKRPDWWGQAKKIDFADYVYEISEIQPDTDETPLSAREAPVKGPSAVAEVSAAPEEF